MKLAAEIEDQQSWPSDFLEEASRSEALVLSYHREQQRIDRLCQEDVVARLDPPENEQEYNYRQLVGRLEVHLAPHRVVGYHCTRLTQDEIFKIKKIGMKLLSPDLVQDRLAQCLVGGQLTQYEYDWLKNSENIKANLDDKNGRRAGMIWFCPNRSTLQEAPGVYSLFKYWGGEAVYRGYQLDRNTAVDPAHIGSPAIVKCAIPLAHAKPDYPCVAERFLSQFISAQVEYPEPPPHFDLYTKLDVAASDVLEIIEFSDAGFSALTGHKSWSTHYQL